MTAPRAPADPELDPTDPFARMAQTFPRLGPELAERVAAFGVEERLPAGTLVFERGHRRSDFLLVVEGSIEIFGHDGMGGA
jgi:thioredoxin reductase (NADPH)